MARDIYSGTGGLHLDLIGFEEAKAKFAAYPKEVAAALRSTIFDTIRYVRETVPAMIVKHYAISLEELMTQRHRAKFQIITQPPAQGQMDMVGLIRFEGNRFPVMRFEVSPRDVPNQKGVPVYARVKVTVITVRGSAQVGIPNRFLARMQSGHTGVYMRKPDATHRRRPDGQWTELNISEEHMISPPEMIASQRIRPELTRRTQRHFNTQFAYYLRKRIK